ncbi:hypothetical protein YC2023_102371 [Brassica napus]
MDIEELKPIASTRAQEGDFEDPEIAEQLRRSWEQPVIIRDRRIRKGHVENPRESDTHTSTFGTYSTNKALTTNYTIIFANY